MLMPAARHLPTPQEVSLTKPGNGRQMRTEEQMAAIITRSMKDLHKNTAHKWGFPDRVLAGATFNLGTTMMIESGYTEEQIVTFVRQIVADLT
jgi:hypothetical protein